MQIKSWPTAAVLMTLIVAIVATVLFSPSLGVDTDTILTMVGGESVLGAAILAWMRGIGQGPTGGAAALALVLFASALASTGCTATQAAMVAAPKVRDLTCGGMRVAARLSDRVCRAAAGPWVVPRSEAERTEDANVELWSMPTAGGAEPDSPGTDSEPDTISEPGTESDPEPGDPEPDGPD